MHATFNHMMSETPILIYIYIYICVCVFVGTFVL